MIVIRILLLAAVLLPFLFVAGTVMSSAQSLDGICAGRYTVELNAVCETGQALKAATQQLTMREMDIIIGLIRNFNAQALSEKIGNLHRMKILAQRSA